MRYIKLFEEFDPKYLIPIFNKIGKKIPNFGHSKICFEFGKNSIIKFFQLEYYNNGEAEIVNCIKQRNINLDVIPKIYKIGYIKPKGDNYFNDLFKDFLEKNPSGRTIDFDDQEELFFIIEEKIFFDNQIQNSLLEMQILYKKYIRNKYNIDVSFLKEIQKEIYYSLKLSETTEDFIKTLDKEKTLLIRRIEHIYKTLGINNIIISDFNTDNFGRNKKGDIITFDLADNHEFGNEKRFDKKDLDYIF